MMVEEIVQGRRREETVEAFLGGGGASGFLKDGVCRRSGVARGALVVS